MIKSLILYVILLFSVFANTVYAADPENIMVIEVEGEANGIIEIQLLPNVAPLHVERIKILARDGLYNDVVFHRVIDGFMAQTGDVKFGKVEGYKRRYAGQGGSNYPDLDAEFSTLKYEKGTVGMARAQNPNSANSQFFIMFNSSPNLDGNYTVIGNVIKGQDVVNSIKRGAMSDNGSVIDPDIMKKVWIKADK
ncbi:peptidylprolyl isomerase [Amylibacter sp.]|jgi:peptidylprolyl isomerase|nr:peptidyl-prolyl cis-trans isomerase, cyclophilin-type [Rhodobacterales bacterium HTCC2255]MBT4322726.1 peptidylprolyl isomerase [Rhodobacterales bacterium]MCO4796102.1 peptidylprolyl isomerase [Amylibacter sp.]MBT6833535.1 peptidylprolyl isomerase [Rhodobacterales bacterium]MDB2332500.1 peptidylprolyl isomerase [Amylibacter sp.]|tara:strand:- start:60 stop:641 length:582 start_codon:yes stop_codon:yes gene_type:complete